MEVVKMTTTIRTRVDADDKVRFASICKSAGLTPSEAINLFIKQTLSDYEIPFKVKVD